MTVGAAEMQPMVTHRTLDGDWSECPAPDTCELKFHLPDITPVEVETLPQLMLESLLEVLDPPTESTADGKVWQMVSAEGQMLKHRDYDLPAVIRTDGSREWWQAGKEHRDHDRPAHIAADGGKNWYQHGMLHRDHDLPASVGADGTQEWWWRDERHRSHGKPSFLDPAGGREYWRHGEAHRLLRPALYYVDGSHEWVYKGKIWDGPWRTFLSLFPLN